jgi:Histidine kinase-, DNA gyrase B-, and HSP90-like ATPase
MAYDIVPPDPASMIESLSALGYTIESAIPDLVNDSIDAGAGTIDLAFHRNDPASYISVADDGKGMTKAELQTAMAMAARGPCTSWSGAELGRFGMGLKTVSFSQTSRLSVWKRSAKNKQPSVRVWDQERVVNSSEWQLLQSRRGRAEDPCTGVGVPVRSKHTRVVTRVVCSTYSTDGSCPR